MDNASAQKLNGIVAVANEIAQHRSALSELKETEAGLDRLRGGIIVGVQLLTGGTVDRPSAPTTGERLIPAFVKMDVEMAEAARVAMLDVVHKRQKKHREGLQTCADMFRYSKEDRLTTPCDQE